MTVEASIQALVASGGGIRLEVLIDGAVVRTTTVGNGGTTTANSPLTVRWRDLLTTSSAHTARARVVNVAGANSVSNDTGQQFTLTIEPALALT